MKVWELHGGRSGGAIRSTPDGEADVAGLVLSERAYLLVLQEVRPAALVELVHAEGAERAAEWLAARFPDPVRGLVLSVAPGGQVALRRADETGRNRRLPVA